VGRRGRPSLVLQLARSEPVDQYLAAHPEYLFEAPRERLGVDPDNLVLLSEQLKCAAFELPFRVDGAGGVSSDPSYGEVEDAGEVLDYLAEESGFLLRRDDTYFWMADAYPAQDVSLAGGELDNVLILEQGTERALGETDRESSLVTCHEGAIYQVQGVTWRIERFDHKNRRAYAKQVESDYYTDAQTDTEVRVLRLEECLRRDRAAAPVEDPVAPSGLPADELAALPAEGEDHSAWRGEVHVTTVATLYKKIRFYTRENVGAGEIHLPPEELDTESFVLTLAEATAAELGVGTADGGTAWSALGELLRRTAPLFVRCQPSDLGLAAQVRSPHFGRPTLYLYDRVQGGVGLSDLLLASHRELMAAALEVVERCECPQGCPACVGPAAEVGRSGKAGVLRLLRHLCRGPAPEAFEAPELDGPEEALVGPGDLASEGALPRGLRTEG
jgi:DEAD/DEAH box helicase domain-containing protein